MSGYTLRNNKTVVGVLVASALILGTATWLVFTLIRDPERSDVNVNTPNYDACLNDAVGARLKTDFQRFDASSTEAMKPVIAEIEAMPNVEGAINCQYVLARSSAHRGELRKSIIHYQNVINSYEADGRWVDILVGVETPEDVRAVMVSYQATLDALLGQEATHRVIWSNQ